MRPVTTVALSVAALVSGAVWFKTYHGGNGAPPPALDTSAPARVASAEVMSAPAPARASALASATEAKQASASTSVATSLEPGRDLAAAAEERLRAGDDGRAALLLFRKARQAPQGSTDQAAAAARLAEIEERAAAGARAAGLAPDAVRDRLSVAYLACLDAARRARYRAALDALNADAIFSSRPSAAAEVYVVKAGDNLTRIAARQNFPADGIQLLNGIRSPELLRVGDRLKVPRGPAEVLVVKAEFRLVILLDGRFVKEYAIGTGRDGCTPEAVFTIDEKIKRPTWYSREGTFPFGHERNILGTRWLGFENGAEYRGFGIHGTKLPESIGKEESSGCIRMRNEDVEEVFALVPKGTIVTITR